MLPRLLLAAGFLLGLAAGRAAAGEVAGVVRGAAANKPASGVSLEMALSDAHRLATAKGHRVVRVEGASMLPYFGDGSVLVVKATGVDSLREGAVVLYRNRFGETVAHRLEAKVAGGWKVRGANNAEADSTLVTTDNLLGAVYATFYSDTRVATELAAVSALHGATTVALAAPAR